MSAIFLKIPDLVQKNEYLSPIPLSNTAKSLDYSINTAITQCGKIHQIHEKLNTIRDGFFNGHRNRSVKLQVNGLKGWLDALCIASCLYNPEQAYEQDASALTKFIAQREDVPFSQQ